VLSATEAARFDKAKNAFEKPVFIVTEEEARNKEKTKATTKKTWRFEADNVRDFAMASSRKFIWDAQAVKLASNTVLAMSFYPKEGLPVWPEESTKAVKNALEIYSKPLPRSHFRQHVEHRHGVSDDKLQWRQAQKRKDQRKRKERHDRHDRSRGWPQLLSHDRQLR
jgi:hypothetical protein